MKKLLVQAALLYFSLFSILPAQESITPGISNTPGIFLDCHECDFTYVRQELPFLSFVRDPGMADIHILVTQSGTGGGGEKFYLSFMGRNEFDGQDYEYMVTTDQSDTDYTTREALLKILKTGVLQYYSLAGLLRDMEISIDINEHKKIINSIDRWKKWVFRIDASSEFQREESQNEYSYSTQGSIEKITENWKTSLEAEMSFDRENYIDDDQTITDKQDSKDISADFVKSLGPKWSTGVFAGYSSQTYINISNRYSLSAGIEYNIFPWSECNRRVFAIRYSVGTRYVNYNELTIYDKLNEKLFQESLEVNLELIQPWGEISVSMEGQHYFHDFSKSRLSLESDLSVRLTRNLSIFSEVESNIVHDQLYLPKGDASVEDILLRRRKLATTYEINGQFGFRFTFGSIYNDIVNERF